MNSLKGKKILFLGSSVTEGSAAGGISFADLLAERDGVILYKEAVCGTTMAGEGDTTYVARMKHGRLPTDIQADAMVCQLSTNDASQNLSISNIEDAIREIVSYTRRTWGCPVFFYTGTRFDSLNYRRMVDLLYCLSEELGFEILDLWNDPEMLAVSPADYARYMEDPIHPRLVGYSEWWYPKFRKFLLEHLA
ncbi:MAG: SGNH/GDSL hydrolase family protein [Eubacteriales bacterium]